MEFIASEVVIPPLKRQRYLLTERGEWMPCDDGDEVVDDGRWYPDIQR